MIDNLANQIIKNYKKNTYNTSNIVKIDNNEMIYNYKGKQEIVKIYDISYDSNGYPSFLIYHNKQWKRRSAKHFIPLSNENNL